MQPYLASSAVTEAGAEREAVTTGFVIYPDPAKAILLTGLAGSLGSPGQAPCRAVHNRRHEQADALAHQLQEDGGWANPAQALHAGR
jgi:hypothetical protein